MRSRIPRNPTGPWIVDDDQRAAVDRRPRHRRRRHQRRRHAWTSSTPTAGGNSRRRANERTLDISPAGVRRAGRRAPLKAAPRWRVYDVNGDGLERRRDGAAGARLRARLVRAEARRRRRRSRSCEHMIVDDFSTKNAGDVDVLRAARRRRAPTSTATAFPTSSSASGSGRTTRATSIRTRTARRCSTSI